MTLLKFLARCLWLPAGLGLVGVAIWLTPRWLAEIMSAITGVVYVIGVFVAVGFAGYLITEPRK